MAFVFGFNGAKAETSETNTARGGFTFSPAVAANAEKSLKSTRKLEDGVEGTVSFTSRGEKKFRYKISATEDKLRVWLEDVKSKKQWQTKDLALEEFVREDSTIPMATFHDYAESFIKCFQPSISDEYSCDLTPALTEPDAWTLMFKLKLRLFVRVWTPTYSMQLKPVALEPTDLLAAKIRDQEEEIRRLQKQVEHLAAKRELPKMVFPVFSSGRTSQQTATNQPLVWKQDGLFGYNAAQMEPSGVIRFTTAATFVVNVTVVHNNSNNGGKAVELQLNGKSVVAIPDSNPHSHYQATSLCRILNINAQDELRVIYLGNNHAIADSQITIHQLH